MGFSWTTPSSGGASIIDDSTLYQIQTNLETLFGDVDYDRPTCTYEDTEALDYISNESLAEIKEDIILADEMNYCRTHYTDHRSSDYATYDITRNLDHNDTEKSIHYADENSDYNATQRTTHYDSRLHTHNVTHDSTKHISVDSSQNSTHLNDHHGGYYSSENSDADSTQNSGAGGGLWWSNYSRYDWAVQVGVASWCPRKTANRDVTLCNGYSAPCGWDHIFNPPGN